MRASAASRARPGPAASWSTLFEQIRASGSMVILATSDGLILHSLGDPDFVDPAQQVALRPGLPGTRTGAARTQSARRSSSAGRSKCWAPNTTSNATAS